MEKDEKKAPVEDGGLAVELVPASIEANFDALEARVREMVRGYEGVVYDLDALVAQGLGERVVLRLGVLQKRDVLEQQPLELARRKIEQLVARPVQADLPQLPDLVRDMKTLRHRPTLSARAVRGPTVQPRPAAVVCSQSELVSHVCRARAKPWAKPHTTHRRRALTRNRAPPPLPVPDASCKHPDKLCRAAPQPGRLALSW